jgi:hypothetical protein
MAVKSWMGWDGAEKEGGEGVLGGGVGVDDQRSSQK